MPTKTLEDITQSLNTVNGGAGAGQAISKVIRGAGSALEKVGGWAGGAMAIKEGWDYLRGNNNSSGGGNATPPAQPAAPAE